MYGQETNQIGYNMFINCTQCKTPFSCADNERCARMTSDNEKKDFNYLQNMVAEYESALRLIASPERPDGTFNRDRRAVQFLAEQTLKKFNKV